MEQRSYRSVGQRVSLGVHSLSHSGSQADHYPQRLAKVKAKICSVRNLHQVCAAGGLLLGLLIMLQHVALLLL